VEGANNVSELKSGVGVQALNVDWRVEGTNN
jgi:hypothetical protein